MHLGNMTQGKVEINFLWYTNSDTKLNLQAEEELLKYLDCSVGANLKDIILYTATCLTQYTSWQI